MKTLTLTLLSTALLFAYSQASFADEVTVNGEPTGVSSEDAKEAFERLGDAMGEAADRAGHGEHEIEVEAPDVRDLDREPVEVEQPDEFDFDE